MHYVEQVYRKNHLKNRDQVMTEYISIKASIVGRNFVNYVYILQTQKFQYGISRITFRAQFFQQIKCGNFFKNKGDNLGKAVTKLH